MRTFLLCIALCCCLLASLSSARADAPTTAPAAKPLPPLDAKAGLLASIEGKPGIWYVFKGWKEQQLNNDSARVWWVPPFTADVSKPNSIFMVAVLSGGKPDATLEQYVFATKKAVEIKSPGVTFTVDKAAEVGGKPGWVLVYDSTQENTVSDDKGNARRVKHAVRTHRLLSLQGEFSVSLSFTTSPDDFDRLMRNVDRSFRSFEWKLAVPK